MTAKEGQINLRVSAELKEEIRVMAQRENRTVTNYILNIIIDDIRQKNNNIKVKSNGNR